MISDRVALRKWVLIVSAKRRRSSNKCESCLVESWLHRLSFDRWTTDNHVQMTCLLILVKLWTKEGDCIKAVTKIWGNVAQDGQRFLGSTQKEERGKGKSLILGEWIFLWSLFVWLFCLCHFKCPVFLRNWLIQEELSVSINRIIFAWYTGRLKTACLDVCSIKSLLYWREIIHLFLVYYAILFCWVPILKWRHCVPEPCVN